MEIPGIGKSHGHRWTLRFGTKVTLCGVTLPGGIRCETTRSSSDYYVILFFSRNLGSGFWKGGGEVVYFFVDGVYVACGGF